MKRILTTVFVICLVLSMSVFSVNAAESYELIPIGASWNKTDHNGASVSVEEISNETEHTVVFSGSVSDTWPCVDTYYPSTEIIKVNIDEYSLVYDFTVSGGATNINFYFTDGFGNSFSYTIANNTLGDVNYEAGSGDLLNGDYRGVVKLSDFVNSSRFYESSKFNAEFITEDNEIIFTGIQVYSVNGATVTVRGLDIVANDEAEAPVGDESSEEAVSDAESSEEAVSEDESSEEESKEESKTESKTESKEESNEASATESTDDEANEGGLGVWLYVIIGVAVVAVIAVVIVLIKKKQ